ncbi:MAG: hypothetical protein E6Q97_16040 [Desulfurellales bacterium]|nr:MAG: hypothetical protein E6Q97_16040 [Desulfurellales bacterium]
MTMANQKFIEPPEWIPLLPTPGKFKHPAYGEVEITQERNQRFIQQFRDGVYQRRLPIDAEHELKAGGAMGWIIDARLNPDGTADGRVEWTERGANLLRDNRFAYVSPEFYDSWTAPDTGQQYADILIGAALTTRPFFKESSLRSLMASEPRIFNELQEGKHVNEQQFTELSQRYTELEQRFAEANGKLEAAQAQAQQFAEQLTQANATIAQLRQSERSKRFGELAQKWIGDRAVHIQTLELFADQFNEDSAQFKGYVQQMDAISAQAKTPNLFSEIGTSAPAATGGDVQSRIDGLVAKKMSEGKMGQADATAAVFREYPNLYLEYKRKVTV